MATSKDKHAPIDEIKAHFILRKSSFSKFCMSIGVDQSNAKKAIEGKWKGDKAAEICELITKETGVEV